MRSEVLETVKRVHDIFSSGNLTISVAESCTGGLLSHYLTLLPGSSAFFSAGLIAYSAKAKQEMLGVSTLTIDRYGMISEETVREMAQRMRLLAGSDYSLSTTGYLGPDALEGKERGLVYIAASREGDTSVRRLLLSLNREENRTEAVHSALQLLIEFTKSHEEDSR